MGKLGEFTLVRGDLRHRRLARPERVAGLAVVAEFAMVGGVASGHRSHALRSGFRPGRPLRTFGERGALGA